MKDKLTIALIFSVSLLVVVYFVEDNTSYRNTPLAERNYLAELHLGLYPEIIRENTLQDIDTGVVIKTDNGDSYRLYESRDTKHFADYGKLIASPIN